MLFEKIGIQVLIRSLNELIYYIYNKSITEISAKTLK